MCLYDLPAIHAILHFVFPAVGTGKSVSAGCGPCQASAGGGWLLRLKMSCLDDVWVTTDEAGSDLICVIYMALL